MWTQTWPLAELRQIDRETRKIITENGGRHPSSSNAVLYLPRSIGGRGLRSVELECKLIKIKAALKVYENPDPMIATVRDIDERASERGHHSLGKDAVEYARELNLELKLSCPHPVCGIVEGEEIPNKQIKKALKQAQVNMLGKEVQDPRSGKANVLSTDGKIMILIKSVSAGCMNGTNAPTHTITELQELYQQLLPTKVYLAKKVKTMNTHDYNCRMCGKEPECRTCPRWMWCDSAIKCKVRGET